ncbi:hypothetical protein DPMN_085376 [Dreissena polymorpha]|uniref:Uncharacterized protein n=1 Tax=Dreissena polymorpha TaxID=45954 RepID=A0A9D4BCT8_DREPO|nr:hypothetical protein DPMN_085376 [Dreissena polymorpha]
MVWCVRIQLWERLITYLQRCSNLRVATVTMAASVTGGQWASSFTKCWLVIHRSMQNLSLGPMAKSWTIKTP